MATKYLIGVSEFAQWVLSAFPNEIPFVEGELVLLIQTEREFRDFKAIADIPLDDMKKKIKGYQLCIMAFGEKIYWLESTNFVIYAVVMAFPPNDTIPATDKYLDRVGELLLQSAKRLPVLVGSKADIVGEEKSDLLYYSQ